jgi:cobalamin biosynthetic protein CobC
MIHHGHGGRLRAAMAAFPQAPAPWLDLSTGINPQPYPAPRAADAERARLPDPERLRELEAAAARAFGCAPERVLATPGEEAAIRLLACTLEVETIAIVEPAYSGPAEAWRATGARVSPVARGPAAWSADALVLANPNNPDGATTAREAMAELAGRLDGEGRWLVVDEAFVETMPGLSVADLALERLVVLRSFGKFYGLAGLRLGFVVADPGLVGRLRARQG